MGRTAWFSRLRRISRLARFCDERDLPTAEGVEMARDLEQRTLLSRRQVLAGMAAAGALAAMSRRAEAAPKKSPIDVAVVGAGLAGLACADRLRTRGVTATVYEAASRVGGRCFSLRGFFPGQVVERGGELIDNLHKTMLGYANAFDLTLEDHEKLPGEVFYYFDGTHHPEAAVVDEYRALTAALRGDLQQMTAEPTADVHNDFDATLDRMNIAEYLASRGAGRLITQALGEAYVAEYGLELEEQSALNMLLFIKVDKRSRFMPFGVFSDERYHVVEGNDAIAQGIADGLARPVELGRRLVRVRKTPGGRIELTFASGNRTETRTHDFAVLGLPFSVLRGVELDASLGLPPSTRQAIDELGYGTNAKMMIGFNGPFWAGLGSTGQSYSDLADHQATWETNPSKATSEHAVLTDYASGERGARLDPKKVQTEAGRFLSALELVYPGALARATRVSGKYLAHLEHWPSNPLTRGSYTCYLPGQFTTIAGNEGKAVGNLSFAGEHTNSFYDWQGFMEGACLSGIDAANALL
jgi:monoamine oxidase